MSQQEAAYNLGLDLKLNILDSSLPTESSSSSLCSEDVEAEAGGEAKSMVVVGCPNCLMYIIMSLESNPRCPKCNSHVLLDFLTRNQSKKRIH